MLFIKGGVYIMISRILCLLLCAALFVGVLAACGRSADPPEAETGAPEQTTVEPEPEPPAPEPEPPAPLPPRPVPPFDRDSGWEDLNAIRAIAASIDSTAERPPSPETPERTAEDIAAIRAAVAAAAPGTEIIVPNGIYRDFQITISASGAEGAPITFRAENPGYVILTGRSTITVTGNFVHVDGFFFTDGWAPNAISFANNPTNGQLTRNAIVNFNPPLATQDTRWVRITGRNHVIVENYFRGKTNRGMMLEIVRLQSGSGIPDNHYIARNFFGDFARGNSNGWETVRIGLSGTSLTGSANCIMEFNFFHRTDGENEIISNKSNGNIYRFNTFYDARGELTLRHGNDAIVEGNLFIGTRDHVSIRVIGDRHQIINNFIVPAQGSNGLQINNGQPNAPGLPHPPLSGHHAARDTVVRGNILFDVSGTFVNLGATGSSGRPIAASGIFENNLLVSPRAGNNVFTINSHMPISGWSFADNVSHGLRPLGLPAEAAAGFRTDVDPQMREFALPGLPVTISFPTNPEMNAGFSFEDLRAPFTPMEIVPEWIFWRMMDGDERFVFNPDKSAPFLLRAPD